MAPISLGLDLDAICKEPRFFKILTKRWPGRVCVVIDHDDRDGVARYLDKVGLRVDFILSIHSHEELLKAICDNDIAYYYQCDDTIIELPQSLKIFRMHTAREDGETLEGSSRSSIHVPALDVQSVSQPDLDNPS